jgi:CheY-like chemotaxis protein
MKVLIVDDSRSSRLMVKTCLKGIEGFQFETDEAEDGEVAFEKAKPGRHNLIIMDIHMPNVDGYEATRMIRSWEKDMNRPAVPIVALTAMDPAQAQTKTKAAGCTTFVSKPVKQTLLAEAIRAVTGRGAAGQTAAEYTDKEAKGMFSKMFGGAKKEEGIEQVALTGMRSVFLAEKQRETGVAMAAIDMGDYATVVQLAYRLKGEGTNFGFSKVSEFGGALAKAIEGKDLKTARNVAQKLMAYLEKAMEQAAA